MTEHSEIHQLRLGLGQVMEYRWNLRAQYDLDVVAVLFVEREPSDQAWAQLCEAESVVLGWPESLDGVMERLTVGGDVH